MVAESKVLPLVSPVEKILAAREDVEKEEQSLIRNARCTSAKKHKGCRKVGLLMFRSESNRANRADRLACDECERIEGGTFRTVMEHGWKAA